MLGVALKGLEAVAVPGGKLLEPLVDLGEGGVTVVSGLAGSQQIKVRSVNYENLRHRCRIFPIRRYFSNFRSSLYAN